MGQVLVVPNTSIIDKNEGLVVIKSHFKDDNYPITLYRDQSGESIKLTVKQALDLAIAINETLGV